MRRIPWWLAALAALQPACRGCHPTTPSRTAAPAPKVAAPAPSPARPQPPPAPPWSRKVEKLPPLPPEVELAQIVVSYKGSAGPWAAKGAAAKRSRQEARELAEELARKARSGEDFLALAARFSDWPFASQKMSPSYGGRLGILTKGTAGLVPALETVPFELKVGQVSDPIESRFGFHVIERLPAMRASEILVTHEGAGWRHAPRSHAEALAIAQKILTELKGGASFAQEAFDRSDDLATAGRGGDLGLFDDRSGVLPLIRETVARLKVGEVAGPIESPLGLLLLKRTE